MSRLTQPSAIKSLLTERGLSPNRVMGQNFLADRNILEMILEAADLCDRDRVLEVGPGLGAVTEWLSARARHVLAVEKDAGLYAWLTEHLADATNLELVHGDALDLDYGKLDGHHIDKMVSNLPYSVGSRILVNLFEQELPPARMVVMLQRDVTDRLTAVCGSSDYGLLALYGQLKYDMRLRHVVSPRCFYPPPSVQSALLIMERRASPRVVLKNPRHFREVVKWFFSRRRKQVGTSCRQGPVKLGLGGSLEPLEAVGIDPTLRPQDVPLETWGALANHLSPAGTTR